jgi:hypothetical protein
MNDGSRRARETWKSWARRSAVAAIGGALLLSACAGGGSGSGTVGGWLDGVRGKTSAEGQSRVSYAAAARIKIYGKPEADSPVIGLLDRYEKIARYQSVSGFAYVEARGNLSGWVRESQLIERLPHKSAEGEPTPPAEATPAPGDSVETEVKPPPDTAPTEPVPPDSGAEPKEPERSVFDPY